MGLSTEELFLVPNESTHQEEWENVNTSCVFSCATVIKNPIGKPLCFEGVQPEAEVWLCHIFTSNGTTQVPPRIGCIN